MGIVRRFIEETRDDYRASAAKGYDVHLRQYPIFLASAIVGCCLGYFLIHGTLSGILHSLGAWSVAFGITLGAFIRAFILWIMDIRK